MLVDTAKLSELLDVVEDTLECPAPFDYNNNEYEGAECPAHNRDITCKECWLQYVTTLK